MENLTKIYDANWKYQVVKSHLMVICDLLHKLLMLTCVQLWNDIAERGSRCMDTFLFENTALSFICNFKSCILSTVYRETKNVINAGSHETQSKLGWSKTTMILFLSEQVKSYFENNWKSNAFKRCQKHPCKWGIRSHTSAQYENIGKMHAGFSLEGIGRQDSLSTSDLFTSYFSVLTWV